MNFIYFLAATVLVIVLISLVYSRRHQRRLAQLRGMSEIEFVRYFSERDVPAVVSEMVYRVFREKARSPNFAPSPEMAFDGVFNEEPEDVDDDAQHILKKLDVPVIAEDVRESWSGGELRTIEDLTMWVNWIFARSSNVTPPSNQ